MKSKNACWLSLLLILMATVACKKQATADSDALELKNTRWLLTKEIRYFPNGNEETKTRNSIWNFSDHHTISILNSDSFITDENGTWNLSNDKITLTTNNGTGTVTRSYKIVSRTDSFLKLEPEGFVIDTSNNGKTSKVEYELVKI
jgi:hypothetical protein